MSKSTQKANGKAKDFSGAINDQALSTIDDQGVTVQRFTNDKLNELAIEISSNYSQAVAGITKLTDNFTVVGNHLEAANTLIKKGSAKKRGKNNSLPTFKEFCKQTINISDVTAYKYIKVFNLSQHAPTVVSSIPSFEDRALVAESFFTKGATKQKAAIKKLEKDLSDITKGVSLAGLDRQGVKAFLKDRKALVVKPKTTTPPPGPKQTAAIPSEHKTSDANLKMVQAFCESVPADDGVKAHIKNLRAIIINLGGSWADEKAMEEYKIT